MEDYYEEVPYDGAGEAEADVSYRFQQEANDQEEYEANLSAQGEYEVSVKAEHEKEEKLLKGAKGIK